MPIELGGGGGRAGDELTNDFYGLDQPYELSGDMSAEKLGQINEMFQTLYKALRRAEAANIANDEALDTLRSVVDGLGSSSGSAGLTLVTHDFDLAALQVLDTAPYAIVPAPGGTSVLRPVMWSAETNTTTASGGPAPVYRLRYTGSAVDLMDTLSTAANSIKNRYQFGVSVGAGFNAAGASAATPPVNAALEVSLSLDLGGTFVGTARVSVLYYVDTTLF